jgi:hypothetical protein
MHRLETKIEMVVTILLNKSSQQTKSMKITGEFCKNIFGVQH